MLLDRVSAAVRAARWDSLRDYLAGLVKSLPERPKAFLVVTAHWETDQPTVSVNPKPGMLYDYYGFPEHTYKLSYPRRAHRKWRRRSRR